MWLIFQKYVGEVFNIISQQSTDRPGCIIELDAITDFVRIRSAREEKYQERCFDLVLLALQQGKQTQLLHVFEEDLILGNEKSDDGSQDSGTERISVMWSQRSSCSVSMWVHELLLFIQIPAGTSSPLDSFWWCWSFLTAADQFYTCGIFI